MKDSFRHTPFRREQPPNAQRGSMELWLSYIESNTVYVLCRRC